MIYTKCFSKNVCCNLKCAPYTQTLNQLKAPFLCSIIGFKKTDLTVQYKKNNCFEL